MPQNRFVLDTHVWISIFHKNRNEALIESLINLDIILVSSDEQCKELLDVIHRPDLKWLAINKPEDCIFFIDGATEIYESQKRFSLLIDYKDNYLVDLAWQSKSILISDDKHFAPLKKLSSPKVKVQSKEWFYKLLGWQ